MAKGRKKSGWWLGAAGVAAVALSGGLYWILQPAPQLTAPETAVVERGELRVELPVTGSIDAVNVIDVGTQVSGRIESLHADFNQRVRAGQLLARIEDDDYRSAHVQAQADVTAAQAGVEAARAQVEFSRGEEARARAGVERAKALFGNARLDLERHQKLLEDNIVTQAVMDRVQAAYTGARSDAASAEALVEQAAARVKGAAAAVEQARALLEQRRARASLAKRNLDYCRITSPVNGVIVSRNVDVGQTVASRLSAPSLFHIAEDLSHMYVYAKLDSSDVGKVKAGVPATFTVNAFPGETYEGKLVQVRINANAPLPTARATGLAGQFQRTLSAGVTVASTSGSELAAPGAAASAGSSRTAAPQMGIRNTVAVYDALIEFRNPEEKLLPGMTAYVTIALGSVADGLKVPSAALRFSPDLPAEEKQRRLEAGGVAREAPVVWVVDERAQLRPVAVKPILTDYVFTAVESKDLQPGMRVATRMP